MRVPVPQPVVPMPVRMRLRRRTFMGVLMMLVVDMTMFVLDRLVRVIVLMAFGQMQPEAKRHQRAGDDELSRERLAQEDDRDERAKERGEREISARSGRCRDGAGPTQTTRD